MTTKPVQNLSFLSFPKAILRLPLAALLGLTLGIGANMSCGYSQEPVEQMPAQVLLMENPDLGPSENRLHFPVLITQGKGFRMKCLSQADEEKVIKGLGFITMPSKVEDPLSDTIVNARLDEQPFLCPKSTNYKIKLYRFNPGDGEKFYLHFPTQLNSNAYGDALYVAGCSGLLEGLKLVAGQAIAADPTPFFGDNIHTIDCFSGAPVKVVPKTFSEWCEKKDLDAEQTKTVKAMLGLSSVGEGALGIGEKCKEAETFLNSLPALNLSKKMLVDLGPLGSLKNLSKLYLNDNRIVDLAPLAGLKNLTVLNLSQNKILNVAPLAGLTELIDLNLALNKVVDLRSFSSLGKLTKLNLSGNGLFDLSLTAISYLNSLKELNLARNQIVNPAPLVELPALEKLDLSFNQIDSAASLSEMKSEVAVNLEGNPLNAETFAEFCAVHRAASTPTGHTVRQLLVASKQNSCQSAAATLESQATLSLKGMGIGELSPLRFFTNLRDLDLSQNAIESTASLVELTQLSRLNLSKNNIRIIDPLLKMNSLNVAELVISENPIEMTTFGAFCLLKDKKEYVSESDSVLVNLLKNYEMVRNCSDAEKFLSKKNSLNLSGKGITTLGPLGTVKAPLYLDLSKNQITDLSPLKNATGLIGVNLSENPELVSLEALANNAQLKALDVRKAKIKNLNPLANSNGLDTLMLDNNQVESLAPLKNLTNLITLSLSNNPLKTLDNMPLSNNMKHLNLANTGVGNISNLAYVNSLETLILTGTPLVYESFTDWCLVSKFQPDLLGVHAPFIKAVNELMTSQGRNPGQCADVNIWVATQTALTLNDRTLGSIYPIRHFTGLKSVNLNNTGISDISSLASLSQVEDLYLERNGIYELSPLSNLQKLKALFLSENNIYNPGPIAYLPSLERLGLRKNNISNAEILINLANAATIDLRENKLNADNTFKSLANKAQSRGALDKKIRVGFYIKGNHICTIYYTGFATTPEFNQIKTRACEEDPWKIDFRPHIDPIRVIDPIVTPIRPRPPIDIIGPRLPRLPGFGR